MIRRKIRAILKQFGAWGTKWRHERKNSRMMRSSYSQLRLKIMCKLVETAVVAVAAIYYIYEIIWFRRGGDWTIAILQSVCRIDYDAACSIYQHVFRNHVALIWLAATGFIFFWLLRVMLNGFTKYFAAVNQGVEALLEEEAQICLPSELYATEQKLNAVKRTLKQRTLEARLAEQRKNELVMYLAHDIRTPLTSVIGYLNLLEEVPELPEKQRAGYVRISLEKACRLERMINEFFEITRYDLQQITLRKERIDLYYMLVQLVDEMTPLLSERNNRAELCAEENLTVYGDADKLARVFQNVLRNAAVYSFPGTRIEIAAKENGGAVEIVFRNEGHTIPQEKLNDIFEKFYRLDEGRNSYTGGSGLGLAIAREIVTLHGGSITAESADDRVEFQIRIPDEEAGEGMMG